MSLIVLVLTLFFGLWCHRVKINSLFVNVSQMKPLNANSDPIKCVKYCTCFLLIITKGEACLEEGMQLGVIFGTFSHSCTRTKWKTGRPTPHSCSVVKKNPQKNGLSQQMTPLSDEPGRAMDYRLLLHVSNGDQHKRHRRHRHNLPECVFFF